MILFKNTLWTIFVLLLLCSCKLSKEDIYRFTRDDFEKTVILQNPETIVLSDDNYVTDPVNYFLIRDTLVLVLNQPNSESLLDLYSLTTGNLLARLVLRGRGPNEFISCYPIIHSNQLSNFIITTDENSCYFIDVESTIANRRLHVTNSLEYWNPNLHPRIEICVLDSDSYIGYNLFYANRSEFNPNGIPEFEEYHFTTGRESNTDIHIYENRFFPGSVNGASIFQDSNSKNIWVADLHSDVVAIYDSNLALIKKFVGPDNYQIGYSSVKSANSDYNFVVFQNDKNYLAYLDYFYNEKYLYLLYASQNGIDSRQQSPPPSEIFKLSWNGELLCNYKLDRFAYSLAVSDDERYIYCVSRDSMGFANFLRYEL